jgi:hypothetical protein
MGTFSLGGEGSAGIHAIIEQNDLGETFVSSLLKGGQLARKVLSLKWHLVPENAL